jgi:uncharacterized protein (DUF1697 family)
MAEQKSCFESMGFTDVRVVLQTGNVIFRSSVTSIGDLTLTIEAGLAAQFNYPAKVIVLSMDVLKAMEVAYPFPRGGAEVHDYLVFLSKPLEWPELVIDPNDEWILIHDSVVYWKVSKGKTLKSEFSKLLSKAKYKNFNTIRNINTVLRCLAT